MRKNRKTEACGVAAAFRAELKLMKETRYHPKEVMKPGFSGRRHPKRSIFISAQEAPGQQQGRTD